MTHEPNRSPAGKKHHPLDRAAAMLRGEDGIEDGPAAPRQLLKCEEALPLETFNKDPFAKGSLRQEWSSTRASSMPYSRVSKLRKAKLAEEE